MESSYKFIIAIVVGCLLISCIPNDNIVDAEAGNYQTFGIYHQGDTLFAFRQFSDQWSILTYTNNYAFRIQNYEQKKVVTIGSIPLDPQSGSSFYIEVDGFGTDNISKGTKKVIAIRKEGNKLLLYDRDNKTSYLVYN